MRLIHLKVLRDQETQPKKQKHCLFKTKLDFLQGIQEDRNGFESEIVLKGKHARKRASKYVSLHS